MATETVEKRASAKSKQPIFAKEKKADLVIYRLLERNTKLREDTPPYPPYKRFPNTDLIKWEFKNEDGTVTEGTRAIRWLPGFGSIFVDEQEAGNRVIPDNVLNNPNNRFEIIDGDIKVKPHEKTKIQFLDYCNRNANSPYRTGSVEAIFSRYSEDIVVDKMADKQAKQKEALAKAFDADEAQVAFHAKYFGIPVIDAATSASRTYKAVHADYVQQAIENPELFLKTYDDEGLKTKFYITKLVEENKISFTLIPGKAAWTQTKEEICDIPAVKDQQVIIDEIFAFSQKPTSEAFLRKVNEQK